MMQRFAMSILAPALGLVALAVSASSAEPRGRVPRFEPGPCPLDVSRIDRPVECGVLVVAENRARPRGRTVTMPVVIAKATAATPKPDPVIYLHGGPGGSALNSGLAGFFQARPGQTAMATPDRDWIFFDQRGSGLGQPNLDCGEVQLTDSGLVSDSDIALMTACHQRLKAAGIDLSQYNSQVIAADVADLRTVLGFDRFNLFGVSYGSRVAFAVQAYAPQGLRAAIHDAPYPPDAKGTQDLPVLVAREVREVLAKCEADEACKARFGGLEPRLTAAAGQWARMPKVVNGKTYTVEDLASWLLDATYSWTGTRSLPRDLDMILAGNMAALDAYMADRSTYQEGQNLTHFCKEELPFESEAAMRASAGSDPLALAIVTTAARYFKACETWNVGRSDPREIQPVRSGVPTLLIASQIDAGCPVDFSHAAARSLTNVTTVEVPNMTHGASRRSVCARAMVHAFLDDPAKPVNTTCLALEHDRLPFILDQTP
jgi:pimeloyl-ACP methyl ester carboxylesterase